MLNTVIGILALIVAIGSYIYTWSLNKFEIDITETNQENIYGETKISFSIQNTSSRSIKIDAVHLFSNENQIDDNGFDASDQEKQINQKLAETYEREHATYLMGKKIPTGLNPYSLFETQTYDLDSSPFDKPIYINAGGTESFSYFVDEIPNKIVVYSNSFSKLKKRRKSFVIHFDEQK